MEDKDKRYEKEFQDSIRGYEPKIRTEIEEAFKFQFPHKMQGLSRLLRQPRIHSLIEDNKKKWSGDHLIDPELVPGVIFVNKKIDLQRPSILDITPTILSLFGVTVPKEMQGKVLFKDGAR